ncbi:MAG: DUF4191 domain-containing protein [Lapillicoccus sp.]
MAKDVAPKDPKSTEPAKLGRVAQVRQVFSAAHAVDPQIGWWMALAFVGVLVVAAVVGVLTHFLWFALVMGVVLGILAATIVLSRRAERAAYKQIEGQPGAAGAALTSLRKGWYFDREPVAADATRANDLASAALVYRAVGRPGVVLVGEGPSGRAQRLLAAERKRVERVAPGVPVTVLRVGDGGTEGEVGITKLTNKVQRLKPVLTKAEVSVVNKRLKALGGVRPPVPKGVDPTKARMDRKAMRGR